MVRHVPLLTLCILSVASAHAQDADNIRKAFEEAKQQQAQAYQEFRRQANEKYGQFAEEAWKWFNCDKPIPKPKDDVVPPIEVPEDDKSKPIPRQVPIDSVTIPPLPKPQPKPLAPIEPQPVVTPTIDVNYFGTLCKVHDNEVKNITLNSTSNDDLSRAWKKWMDQGDPLLKDCLELRQQLGLCDWAYWCLLLQTTEQIFGGQNNSQALGMAYLYGNSGYALRLVRVNGKLYLFFGTEHLVCEKPGFVVDGLRYYTMGQMPERFEVYALAFPKEQPMSLLISQLPNLNKAITPDREIRNPRTNGLSVTVNSNKNLIDFYDTYPTSYIGQDILTRWAMYANTPASPEMRDQLYPQLKEQLDGLEPIEAVKRVLKWVQHGFTYGYDNEIWGGDRAFFADETLFYPKQDCEDRSILFTRIVRDLIGLPCVLVYYPGHLATAVSFDDVGEVKGDYLTLRGRKFTICDPTYVGAPIGRTMPKMDNSSARAILLTMDK